MNYKNITKEGLDELSYVVEYGAKFSTYTCPFIKVDCEIKLMRSEGRYKNREECLECKEKLLSSIIKMKTKEKKYV